MECLSGMKGNFHVPFLEEGERVIALPYSALRDGRFMLVWCDETKDQLLNSEETQRVRNHRKNVINRTIIIIANIAWILPQTNVRI